MERLSDRYSLGERIGRGGVGEVFRGLQIALDRRVAIKLLRPELLRSEAAVARFEREAQSTSQLNHPNVVTVHDFGVTPDGACFVVMELLRGETLGERLRRRGALPVGEVLDIAWQVVRGMGAAQGVGLVHRDLKPDNIFVLEDDTVKVLDFGLAILLEGADVPSPELIEPTDDAPTPVVDALQAASLHGDSSAVTLAGSRPESEADPDGGQLAARLTRPGAIMGTPRYMAPEQVLGWSVDHRTDLYAFGVILFELLAGRSPFPGPSSQSFLKQHLHIDPLDLLTLNPRVPRPVARVVHTLLAKSPGERYPDWAALAEALRKISGVSRPTGGLSDAERETWVPTEPFRFLEPFTAAFRSIFFGRDADAARFRELWEHPDAPPMLLLTGASGVGKSSFVSARVIPGLEDIGHQVFRVQGTPRPLSLLEEMVRRELGRCGITEAPDTLSAALDALVEHTGRPAAVVIDQAEEALTTGDPADAAALRVALSSLLAGWDRRVRMIFSIREDYLGALLRGLSPLPMDRWSRTLSLAPLERTDLIAALREPGMEGLPVAYAPFSFEEGLVEEIVSDILADTSGEVAPRIQAVGARLWEMVRRGPEPHVITQEHYRFHLGGAQGIIGRILDEAIGGLEPEERGVARELLRALTHLPGSATSRPAPETELVSSFDDDDGRRREVLRKLEDRWRIVQGGSDARWPDSRVYRITHEALIARIQQYGEESTGLNRARKLMRQGFSLWLQGGQRDEDLLPEKHFDEIAPFQGDLVLRTAEERAFFKANQVLHDEGWDRRQKEQRRARRKQIRMFILVPASTLLIGFALGQAPVGFSSVTRGVITLLAKLGTSRLDLSGVDLRGLDLRETRLRAAVLTGTDLRGADLTGADFTEATFDGARLSWADLSETDLVEARFTSSTLRETSLRWADVRQAVFVGDLSGGDFTGARFNPGTQWPGDTPPEGALGPGGSAPGLEAAGRDLREYRLPDLSAPGGDFTEATMKGIGLSNADLTDARLVRADLTRANLTATRLPGADLSGATLTNAVLRRADLSGADLSGADLSGADLGNATLRGANVCGANLSSVMTFETDWRDVQACQTTRWPQQTAPQGVRED